jgi:hypothetical protein
MKIHYLIPDLKSREKNLIMKMSITIVTCSSKRKLGIERQFEQARMRVEEDKKQV